MNIMCAYIPQGLVIGDFTKGIDEYLIKNPVLIISRQDNIAFVDLLQFVEENKITVKSEDISFGTPMTPKRDIINHYNRLFGSGIQIVGDPNALQF